jgi:hypothetical protein
VEAVEAEEAGEALLDGLRSSQMPLEVADTTSYRFLNSAGLRMSLVYLV